MSRLRHLSDARDDTHGGHVEPPGGEAEELGRGEDPKGVEQLGVAQRFTSHTARPHI